MNTFRTNSFLTKTENNSVQEAAADGLQSLENLIGILSSHSNTTSSSSSSPPAGASDATDYIAVADVAVNKFKKFISLLDRNRTGHARFRRGPVVSAPVEKVYSPAPIQQRPPPPPVPPTNIHHSLVKSGSFDRKDFPVTTISFASAGAAGGGCAVGGGASSFRSSLTGDTDSLQQSMSSGFQITNMSQVSSVGQPSSSYKRKCNSIGDSHTKCANSSGRCHCSKKR